MINNNSIKKPLIAKLVKRFTSAKTGTSSAANASLKVFQPRISGAQFSTVVNQADAHKKMVKKDHGSRSKSPMEKPSQVQQRSFKKSHRLGLCSDSGDKLNSLAEGTNVWLPKTCGFIGGGQMADALLGGFLAKNAFLKENIVVSDIVPARLDYMQQKFGVKVTTDNVELIEELKVIVLSVKP